MGRFRWLALVLPLLMILVTLPTPDTARAAVYAPYWIIYDVTHDAVLDQEQMNQRVPMASLTKTMTGLLVAETLSMSQEVTIVERDLVGEASIWVQPDDVVTVKTLLHGMMMRSGNDAAAALARAAGGSPDRESQTARQNFIRMMNERADELGMHDTRFQNPHGLDADDHYSTARDLARLAAAVLENPTLTSAFGGDIYEAEGFLFDHTNQLPDRYTGVVGGKTGWTDNAGLCLIEVVERDGRTLIVVLLGSTFERWYEDAIELSDYGWTIPTPATTPTRAEVVFEWWKGRTDDPVERGEVARSWLWGPQPISGVRYERYSDAPNGQRMVQYFDKGRMEINDPDGQVASSWYVTGGHLALELITGKHQTGDNRFVSRSPARIPIAGDPGVAGPTYADFRPRIDSTRQQPGDTISLTVASGGFTRLDSWFSRYEVELLEANVPTGHGIASVFADYLNQSGPVHHRGQTATARLFDPTYALVGYPVTEPAWVHVPVNGVHQDVLVQCFERRCLTYTPSNPSAWQVEMGNIGQHYLEWDRSSTIASLFQIPSLFRGEERATPYRRAELNPPPFVTGL